MGRVLDYFCLLYLKMCFNLRHIVGAGVLIFSVVLVLSMSSLFMCVDGHFLKVTKLSPDLYNTKDFYNVFHHKNKYGKAYYDMREAGDNRMMGMNYVDDVPVFDPSSKFISEKYFNLAWFTTAKTMNLDPVPSACFTNTSYNCSEYIHTIPGMNITMYTPKQNESTYYQAAVVIDQTVDFGGYISGGWTFLAPSDTIFDANSNPNYNIRTNLEGAYDPNLMHHTSYFATATYCFNLTVPKNVIIHNSVGLTVMFLDGQQILYSNRTEDANLTQAQATVWVLSGEHRLDFYSALTGQKVPLVSFYINVKLSQQCTISKQKPCDAVIFGTRFMDPSVSSKWCHLIKQDPSSSSQHLSSSSSGQHMMSSSSSPSGRVSSSQASSSQTSSSHYVSSSSSTGIVHVPSSSSTPDTHQSSSSYTYIPPGPETHTSGCVRAVINPLVMFLLACFVIIT